MSAEVGLAFLYPPPMGELTQSRCMACGDLAIGLFWLSRAAPIFLASDGLLRYLHHGATRGAVAEVVFISLNITLVYFSLLGLFRLIPRQTKLSTQFRSRIYLLGSEVHIRCRTLNPLF